MSRVQKNILQICLFVSIFATLLIIATFLDLQISNILASGGLESGKYYTSNIFGRIMECIGSFPIFFLGAFACLIFMHHFYQFKDARRLLSLLFLLIGFGLIFYFYHDTMKYIARFITNQHTVKDYLYSWWGLLVMITLSLSTTAIGVIFYHKVSFENNRKLFNFAFVIIGTCVLYMIINLIKGPVGRMRFRAMTLIGNDFSYYTPWYVISDAKEAVEALYPGVVSSDGFKSFPSGHTFSAGTIYALICLPDVFERFNNKKWRVLWYVIPICYTGIVALGRIVAGAHFMSDVLIGGTLAYFGAELFRYIFITRKIKKAQTIEEKEITNN